MPSTNRTQRLYDVTTSMLLVWVTRDTVVPSGCIDAYREAISSAKVTTIESAGHRPEDQARV